MECIINYVYIIMVMRCQSHNDVEDEAVVVDDGEVEKPHGDDHALHDEHQKCCKDDPPCVAP